MSMIIIKQRTSLNAQAKEKVAYICNLFLLKFVILLLIDTVKIKISSHDIDGTVYATCFSQHQLKISNDEQLVFLQMFRG